jgi:3-hydroxyacyl-[acyl-carrier-protein] dehydratase
MPFAFIDRDTDQERRTRIRAFRNFTGGEEFFRDHFPGYPTVPGSLLLESLTQAATALIEASEGFQQKALPVLIERAKYRHRVKPGDRLDMEGSVVEWSEQTVRTDFEGRVNGDVAIHADITMAVIPIEKVYRDRAVREIVLVIYRDLLEGARLSGFEKGIQGLP